MKRLHRIDKRSRGWLRWLDSITNSINMNLSKLQEGVKDRAAWHAAVCGVGHDLETKLQQHRVGSKRVPSTGALVPMGLGCIPFPAQECSSHSRSSSNLLFL